MRGSPGAAASATALVDSGRYYPSDVDESVRGGVLCRSRQSQWGDRTEWCHQLNTGTVSRSSRELARALGVAEGGSQRVGPRDRL